MADIYTSNPEHLLLTTSKQFRHRTLREKAVRKHIVVEQEKKAKLKVSDKTIEKTRGWELRLSATDPSFTIKRETKEIVRKKKK